MPVSKKRKQNNRPTQSKKISSQMSTSDVPSPRWYTILMSSLMIIGVLLNSSKLSNFATWISFKMVFMEWSGIDWCRFFNDYEL
jgi:hypothetical protein